MRSRQFITLEKARRNSLVLSKSTAYEPVTALKKVAAYGLIAYGVTTLPLPTGSQLAIIAGLSMLGVSPKRLYGSLRHILAKVWYVLKLCGDKKRFKYELSVLKMRLLR